MLSAYGYIGSIRPVDSENTASGYMCKVLTIVSWKDPSGKARQFWASISDFAINFDPEVRSGDSIYNMRADDFVKVVKGDMRVFRLNNL